MKQFIYLGALLVSLSAWNCNKSAPNEKDPTLDNFNTKKTGCLQGKIVKKGLCGQLVVQLLSQQADGLQIAAAWHDSSTGTTHQNVFSVANYCDQPQNLSVGQIINFSVQSSTTKDCAICQAYTPIPEEKTPIQINCN